MKPLYHVESDLIGYWIYRDGIEIGFAPTRREAAKICRDDWAEMRSTL